MSQVATWGVPRDAGESGTPYPMATMMPQLDAVLDAILSSHSGTAEPSYAVLGLVYLDTSTAPYRLRIWDGTQGPVIGVLDVTAHTFMPFDPRFVSAVGITSGTVIPSGTPTKAAFLEQSDTAGAYATGTYTASAAGVYDIRYNTLIPSQASGFASLVSVYVNGVERERASQIGGSDLQGTRQMVGAHLLSLSAADTVEVYVTQTFGSSITVSGADAGNDRWWFKAMRVA